MEIQVNQQWVTLKLRIHLSLFLKSNYFRLCRQLGQAWGSKAHTILNIEEGIPFPTTSHCTGAAQPESINSQYWIKLFTYPSFFLSRIQEAGISVCKTSSLLQGMRSVSIISGCWLYHASSWLNTDSKLWKTNILPQFATNTSDFLPVSSSFLPAALTAFQNQLLLNMTPKGLW